ncbi:ABC transporter permease [Microbacterium excoecariae]|uniref:ABC transporter permease n=1 Tax=Microbacterium excoecariae TaxID=2715210 RepID=UPI00140AA0F9|nr:ABC transporter permease [Microbacterium excoecariae]NHI17504.1 ABC transporter permease [Microbacterium excoecariae]
MRRVRTRSWKLAITLGAVTVLLALLFAFSPRPGLAVFRLAGGPSTLQLGDVSVPAMPAAFGSLVLLAALSVWAVVDTLAYRRTTIWVPIAYAAFGIFGFLAWAGADGLIPVVSLLSGALSLSVPLVLGGLGGVIGERVGVVNVAIEGQLLLGAFSAAVLSSITDNPFVGLLGAMVGGVLVALVLAVFSIKYFVEQVIVGVVLNVLVLGLTTFLYGIVLVPNELVLNRATRFPKWPIPGLSEIPVVGAILFNQTFVVYLMYILVGVVAWGLYRTRWGLRVRAVGEHPQAADTVGIKVNPTRFWNVTLAGAIAGAGGAYFTLVSVPQFGENMTAGLGFIALAAVIFGQWDPIKTALAGLLFGFANQLQGLLVVFGTPIPSQFMLMLPYLVTILAVVGFVGRSRAPAASGKPYRKG